MWVWIILLLSGAGVIWGDPICSCDEFFERGAAAGEQCFPTWTAVHLVKTLDQAEFLCSSDASCTQYTWRTLDKAIFTVSEQRDGSISGWLEVQMGATQSAVFPCHERGITNRAIRRASLVPGSFGSASACSAALCPEATIDLQKTPTEWHRYVNAGNKLVCNVAACRSHRGASSSGTDCACQSGNHFVHALGTYSKRNSQY
jgi:hypothetical protein